MDATSLDAASRDYTDGLDAASAGLRIGVVRRRSAKASSRACATRVRAAIDALSDARRRGRRGLAAARRLRALAPTT